MKASGARRTSGMVCLAAAAIAVAVLLHTLLFRDDGPVRSYVALTAALSGSALVLLTSSGNRRR